MLLPLRSHRNTQVRKMTSKFICLVVEGFEPSKFLHSSKDMLEKSLPAIVQLTKDSSPDSRYYARRALSVLWPEPDFYQVANKVLKSNTFTEAKEAIETLKVKVKIAHLVHSSCKIRYPLLFVLLCAGNWRASFRVTIFQNRCIHQHHHQQQISHGGCNASATFSTERQSI